tara:strand:+ start:632 stop:1276 length:645 start_codon:yes stop_codon:yes gene_type:complete
MLKKLLMTTIMALMISGVSYADELRLEAKASAKLGDLTLSVEEQVRHDLGVSEEMVTTAAPYEHTVFVATKSVGSTDVSLRVRNTNTAGASTNRLSLDADNGCSALGLDINNRLRLQLDNISNIKDVTTKQLALRDRLDVSKTIALAGQDLKLSLADEVFADETGLTTNRAIASVGTKISAVNVTAEYFLQTDQVTSEDRSNSHVVGVYASLSF